MAKRKQTKPVDMGDIDEDEDAELAADKSEDAARVRELSDFFSAKGTGFKDIDNFEAALKRNGIDMDRLCRVVDLILKRAAPGVRLRAIEALRRLAELIYGTELHIRQDALEQETQEELEAKKADLINKAKKLWSKGA